MLGHTDDGQQFAVKIFDLENKQNDKKIVEYLKAEVESTKEIKHPNIVKYYEFSDAAIMQKKSGKELTVAYLV